ncbi:hypothetical protein TNCV_51101 [Trichonephila clavipes]|nr:hypothetical protein TNCV_51101 [Trichonephila clavipes]
MDLTACCAAPCVSDGFWFLLRPIDGATIAVRRTWSVDVFNVASREHTWTDESETDVCKQLFAANSHAIADIISTRELNPVEA